MQNLRWKLIALIVVFVAFFAVGVYPMFAGRFGLPAPTWLMDRALKLGLDLKGGVHLVLRVQTDTALRVETEASSERLRDALSTAGIPGAQINVLSPTQFRVEGIPTEQDGAFRTAAADLINF